MPAWGNRKLHGPSLIHRGEEILQGRGQARNLVGGDVSSKERERGGESLSFDTKRAIGEGGKRAGKKKKGEKRGTTVLRPAHAERERLDKAAGFQQKGDRGDQCTGMYQHAGFVGVQRLTF